jgi:hypothetical protein
MSSSADRLLRQHVAALACDETVDVLTWRRRTVDVLVYVNRAYQAQKLVANRKQRRAGDESGCIDEGVATGSTPLIISLEASMLTRQRLLMTKTPSPHLAAVARLKECTTQLTLTIITGARAPSAQMFLMRSLRRVVRVRRRAAAIESAEIWYSSCSSKLH